MEKPEDTEDAVNQRIGIAASVIMNLTNQQLNIYADKLGIMMIAAGNSKIVLKLYFVSPRIFSSAGTLSMLQEKCWQFSTLHTVSSSIGEI